MEGSLFSTYRHSSFLSIWWEREEVILMKKTLGDLSVAVVVKA